VIDPRIAKYRNIVAGQLAIIVEKSRLYQELVELNQMKDRFLGMAAHDLRNPIATLMNYIEFFLESQTGKLMESQENILHKMHLVSDKMLNLVNELLSRIATLLGGRAAEEIMFDDISTGAHNDLSRATDIARSMVKEYGMSGKIGQVYFARKKSAQFLDMGFDTTAEYSEATAELIDDEVREIISTQYARALEILRGKKKFLEKTARVLLEKEKIDGTDLKALMAEES